MRLVCSPGCAHLPVLASHWSLGLLLASDWPRLAPVSRGRAWHGRREAAAEPGRYQRQREVRPGLASPEPGGRASEQPPVTVIRIISRDDDQMMDSDQVIPHRDRLLLSSGDVTSSVCAPGPALARAPPGCLCFEPHRRRPGPGLVAGLGLSTGQD